LATLQAFFDESYTANGCFVLAGYVATAEEWIQFSKDWEVLLPLTHKRNGIHRFKMTEMMRDPESVIPFFRVIEKYVRLNISYKIIIPDVQRARERIWIDGKRITSWNEGDDPYSLIVMSLLRGLWFGSRNGTLPKEAQQVLSEGRVEFIFDEPKKPAVLKAFDGFMTLAPEAGSFFSGFPRFADDTQCLPLQAADFLAWTMRKAYETGSTDRVLNGGDYGWCGASRPMHWMAISQTEDEIADTLIRIMRATVGPSVLVFDAKYHPKPREETEEEVEARNKAALEGLCRRITWLPRFLFSLFRRGGDHDKTLH
jgi:hypothetical protein